MGLFNSKPKVDFYVRLSYIKETRAEIAKNYFKDKKILNEVLSREGSHFKETDFTYVDFENDGNKIFNIYVKVSLKDSSKFQLKLETELKNIFDCSDIEISKTLENLKLPNNSSDSKKKVNNTNLTNSTNDDNSQKTINSVSNDKNQKDNRTVNSSSDVDSGNTSQVSKDNSSYQKSPYEKEEDDDNTSDQSKEFKYF